MRIADDDVRAEFHQLGNPGEAAFVDLVPKLHRAIGADGERDHDRQQVDGKVGPRGGFDLREEIGGERRLEVQALVLAHDGGVAAVSDLDAELGEGARDEIEVLRDGVFNFHLAAGDCAEGEEGDDLVVVGADGERAALEFFHAGDGELARAAALDLRAHGDERGAEILHVRLARGVEEHGLAVGEHGGHHEILRRGDGHVVWPVASALEAALERHDEVGAV